MRILIGGSWRAGFLDPWCGPGDRRIEVRRWIVVHRLDDLFIEQPYDVRRVIDYAREVGPVEVARKVLSRLSESWRNEKVAACGLGIDLETGEPLRFFAPCVAPGQERVVVARELTWATTETCDALEWAERLDDAFAPWAGWVRDSGHPLSGLGQLQELVETTTKSGGTSIDLGSSSVVEERRSEPVEGERLRASVFGYGHYVRTMVLPSLPPEIEVTTVHELDPVLAPDSFPTVDTCPHLRTEERADIVVVAGFHHTHARLAADAMKRGSAVICEKPLATSPDELEDLLSAWAPDTRYFASYQRRFFVPNQWAMEDLGWSENNPMSYHALVHEVSLPAGHWYHWPSSGSRMLSNGCHWVDHFLWLNDFSPVAEARARFGPNGEILAELVLENGAFFTLTLTDRGSDRLGVREHTELRVKDRTAIIEDMSSYVAEGPRGVIRREAFPRLAAHRAMYTDFARRILGGEGGDSRASVEISARAVLALEQDLQSRV